MAVFYWDRKFNNLWDKIYVHRKKKIMDSWFSEIGGFLNLARICRIKYLMQYWDSDKWTYRRISISIVRSCRTLKMRYLYVSDWQHVVTWFYQRITFYLPFQIKTTHFHAMWLDILIYFYFKIDYIEMEWLYG